jgi:heptosyltransferase-1
MMQAAQKRLSHEETRPILVIRLGAMGDIIHTLPAAISLKKSFPHRKLSWLVAPRWLPLLEGNPYVDQVIPFDRTALGPSWRALNATKPGLAFDFQGLVQSALAGRAARPLRLFGFDQSVAREPLAAFFYSERVPVVGPHRVERNVQLAAAAGALDLTYECWIPPGEPSGELPITQFVLTSPFAGWAGKEWPLELFDRLGQLLRSEGMELVANVPQSRAGELARLKHVRVHTSTLAGLIYATRQATAVVGLDSGPLHLAAALGKPGVALFGPTDPTRTGPFGGSMSVLRADDVETTYKRHGQVHASMRVLMPESVAQAVLRSISAASVTHERTEPGRIVVSRS